MQTKLKLVMHGYGEAKMSSIFYFKFLIRIPNITASTACSTSTSSRTFKLLESSVHYYKQIASILHLRKGISFKGTAFSFISIIAVDLKNLATLCAKTH